MGLFRKNRKDSKENTAAGSVRDGSRAGDRKKRAEKRRPSRPMRTEITRPDGTTTQLADKYAHRGFHDKPQIPENSMAAFRRAVERGFASELDVHRIADGTLVIFHDDDLERETGVKGWIADYDIVNLRRLRLEGTDEPIPTFDEVLDLYEGTGLKLLIELKVDRGNYRELAEAVCERLDRYTGEYVIESFDPRVLMVIRRIRPDIIRGQLAQNFFRKREGLPFYQAVFLTNMMLNRAAKPDFVAYKFADRDNRALRRAVDRRGALEASWTIRTPGAFRAAVKAGCIPIFEKFDPDAPDTEEEKRAQGVSSAAGSDTGADPGADPQPEKSGHDPGADPHTEEKK